MSVLERAISALSPSWAARRAAQRLQLRQVERIGGGMRQRRRPDMWRVNDPATRKWEARQGKPMSRWDREMIREVFDLNPFAAKLLNALLNNAVGFGITATLKGTAAACKAWKLWERHCDYDGVLNLYGLQELIASTFFVDGEVFVILRAEKNPSGIPLQLQVLDADMLDTTSVLANVRIRDGVEYDENGRPTAYFFKSSRELNEFQDPVRVPAAQVIHLFKRRRPGQRRGRSQFEPVLDVLEDVDGYLEAEGVRKKIAACFVGFRSLGVEADDPAMGTIETDGLEADEPPVESFYPGMIINGRQGEKMEFGQPPRDAGVADYMKWGGLRIAAGGQATYEHVTGDLSNVNYSSYRAGNMEFQRFIGRTQWLSLLPQCLDRIADAATEAMMIAGVAQRRPTVTWTPPPFGSVDPKKDVETEILEMAAQVRSRLDVVAARGTPIEDLVEEIVTGNKLFAAAGLDPAVPTNKSGGNGEPASQPE